MSDSLIQPCLRESNQWPTLYQDIETQRSKLEAVAIFERQVQQRADAHRNGSSNKSKVNLKEETDLASLSEHSLPPIILSSEDLRRAAHGQRELPHRQKINAGRVYPYEILVARPVSWGGIRK